MNNQGYTLIEVMISATLLAIIVLGTMQYFTLSRWQVEKGIRAQLAWANMASRMEKAIDLGYASLQDSLPETSVSLILNGIQGYRTTIVTSIDDSADGFFPSDTSQPDYYDVTIKFAWFTTNNITDSLSCSFSEERGWTY
ncbi:MAG: prepilin-type N-terminal cleavage/methylation domain-containing protein [Candidatus Marinimicrobia bacterium]|jgi:prepilin-type N-terminal cleavage/methylation domain-containing protein|nr:prepilin-type N-terminal cleavage/methylation domain-containing protein [Candidatus Neomarinimicrobiota bacterium]MBT3632094.1 prepilin-type N-terminal cleavage/methylation domain-containing protein [Candidatus Neomarinimicrobiota bacterium]MBT4130711.1 prepilin-type N-terminal cleavage/methylation domain-containing protein [Candidatus Neomarinimicrobiota bacterium]MBT4294550.1 prepilin-type N-terminal cleavage/methylation domain-containing protein [Candidatus Neomarinimicrobiota bacterium]M